MHRLGGDSRRHLHQPGALEASANELAHQSKRITSHQNRIVSVPGEVDRILDPSEDGQYDHILLHKEDGRNQVNSDVSVGNEALELVLSEINRSSSTVCTGQAECVSGFSVQRSSDAVRGFLVRSQGVESTGSSSYLSVHEVGSTCCGSVCLQNKQEVSDLLHLGGGSQCVSRRRLQYSLVGDTNVCLPSETTDFQGIEESSGRQSGDHSDCASMAPEAVVQCTPQDDSGLTCLTSSISESTEPERNGSRQSGAVITDRLENIRMQYYEQGISRSAANTMLASVRQSSQSLYQGKWTRFCRWCDGRKIDPICPTIVQIIQFLQELFDQGLAASTLRGYVAALSPVIGHFDDKPLAHHPLVCKFLQGTLMLRPPSTKTVPRWELPVVLTALMEKDFEPPDKCSLRMWTWKTVFLLAVTSFARCSELQALDIRPQYTVFRDGSASLSVNKFFLPKTYKPGQKVKTISLKSFCRHPKNREEKGWRLVCPVRALRLYKEKTSSIRKDNQLFISYSKDSLGCKVTSQTLSRWITNCITTAYGIMGRQLPSQVSGHSTRSMGASMADLAGVSIQDICQAADWSSGFTFAKYYRLDTAVVFQ